MAPLRFRSQVFKLDPLYIPAYVRPTLPRVPHRLADMAVSVSPRWLLASSDRQGGVPATMNVRGTSAIGNKRQVLRCLVAVHD